VPAAPILDVKAALDNPFVTDEGRLQDIELAGHGTYRYLRPAVQAAEPAPARPAPKLGEHTRALLSEIGYDDAELKKLRQNKVI
jgi:crotonobetainyl-CoA:carnitine CoA-transferase CaiB-like acyl-CoA transferase